MSEIDEQPRRSRGIRQYFDGPDDFKEGEEVSGFFVKFYQARISHWDRYLGMMTAMTQVPVPRL